MTYKRKNLADHLKSDGQPKRILALDGGGLRGILTVGALQKIEDVLRERHGGSEEFRLCHYFDLIAGTSTGAIIAAALAQGWTVQQVYEKYMALGNTVFEKSFFRKGLFRAKYDEGKLIEELKEVYGEDTTLGSDRLKTGLLVVTKRLDSGSPWPLGNNPKGKYHDSRPGGTIGNGDYPLWQVVRASTAAPTFFDPEEITISEKQGHPPTKGNFVDGGVSPYNNPALQALMYATLEGNKVGWPLGEDNVFLVSVGTGSADPEVARKNMAAAQGLSALQSLMEDCAAMQETMLQWMSSSPTAKTIDRQLGSLDKDLIAGQPLLQYMRYNVELTEESVRELLPGLNDVKQIESLSEMDAPENMNILHELGVALAKRDVENNHFPQHFDLPGKQFTK